MNYWKHSLLSAKKFNGHANDYLAVHKFMDASKLFYYHMKHRVLLHNTYGIELCIRKFGETLVNADQQTILIRDIAAEHCREDLMGFVPTLNNWFTYTDDALADLINPVNPADTLLKEFVFLPLVMSGLPASLIITHSNFGVYLVKEMMGIDYALEWASHLEGANIVELLKFVKLTEKWQHTPDIKQIKKLEDERI
ncbi:DUF6915 family protein [Chitinophaga sancti]|uniref:DUF6915 domain-containing protein n=1 Tax=Chitinophaga sancti TaxID=1004 RepID=A0A1K1QPR0_9BACT|nr:hypothetical protein [Chitinophaga sancti]WQD65086.1 hypothetical protein U0033_11840 [Chitinophaga sancti]WQG89290.1 hypothetical protein SR876_30630 [Chitinophaga sancti]SFW61246.1 hypothetical protein SAMN05661012_02949 [Chitinophaga sancti]